MSSDGEKNGVFDRLATKLFASTSSPLSAFADQQRAERLASCRQLESILNSCQAELKNEAADFNADTLTSGDVTVATTRSGIRIARFFRWNLPHADHNKSDSSEIVGGTIKNADGTERLGHDNYGNVKSNFSHGCHKETHELWACRALALGCGNYLSDLRRCWDETSQIHARNNSPTNQNSASENDDVRRNRRADACREIQQNMAKCVTKNASELAERIEARRK
ncbi:hypothetical protein HJC23_013222 [Cyclotella cryptica]|uniref:Uncharacterized protein n=1 Tax=Cyclotella cryptica TaxID=29204 RepID=A0ABD3NNS7_9STRA|eukprot:CCRYP_020340-RA/>CCRYP_020340-RA protein AED:0.00 eAED:0.00 QI:109/-1/1/1/-1/1/1/64/223